MRALIAAALLAITGAASAYPGLRFDPSTLVTPAVGSSSLKVQNTSERPSALGPNGEDDECVAGDYLEGGTCGAMRTAAKVSHMSTTDPLLFPGNADGSHLHTFIGNVTIDENTDVAADLWVAGGNSTAKGGSANRTAYWFPSMIDVRDGSAVAPRDGTSEGQKIYYKTLHAGATRINTLPRTFRMIAGTSSSTGPQPAAKIQYRCAGTSLIVDSFADLPWCGATTDMVMTVGFPQCVALDGEAPFGTLSGSYLSAWKPIPTFWELMYFEGTSSGNITDLVVTAGGGYTAPTVVKDRDGTSTLRERAHIVITDMTAGQWIEVAGRRYTSTGASTALQVAQALQGGSPLTNSPDHKSHVAFQTAAFDPTTGCQDAFPYAVPEVVLEIHYRAAAEEDMRAWRLSSDMYKGKPGYSGHGDVIFAWDEDIHRAWVLGCDRTGGDCHAHLIGCKDPDTGEETQCRKMSF